MKTQKYSCDITLTPFDNKRLLSLCGRFDEHLRQIEQRLVVDIIIRGNIIHITGSKSAIELAAKTLHELYRQTATRQRV